MQAQSLTSQPSKWSALLGRILNAGIAAYIAITCVAFIILPITFTQVIRAPYIGAFVENTLIVSPLVKTRASNISPSDPVLQSGEMILSIEGQKIQNIDHFYRSLGKFTIGDQVEVALRSYSGETRAILIPLDQFASIDLLSHGILPYLSGLVALGIGIWIFSAHRHSLLGKVTTIFSISFSLSVALFFDALTMSRLVHLWLFGLSLLGGSLFLLGLIYPEESEFIRQRPILRWLGILAGMALFLYAVPWQYNPYFPYQYLLTWRFIHYFLAFSLAFFLGSIIYRVFRSPTPNVREQSRLTLIGAILGFTPVMIWFILSLTPVEIPFTPILLVALITLPISLARHFSRSHPLQTDFIAGQVILYTVLTLLSAIGYGLFVTGATLVFQSTLKIDNPFLVGTAVFLLAFAFLPLREQLQKYIDKAFGRDQEAYRQQILDYSHELTQVMDIHKLTELVRNCLAESLSPTHIHIFINNPGSSQYSALTDSSGKPTSELFFTQESGLVSVLSARRSAIYLGKPESIPTALASEQPRLALLGSHLFVPLPGQQRLIGWISLGAKKSGQPYNQRDMNYLESLSDQTALAFERAQVIQDLEQRVHQMNVLTRMTQGTTVTVSFDDILELIYAQSNQILPSKDFRIALSDKRNGSLICAFYLENDERLLDLENSPVPEGQGLEHEIFRQGRLLITDDYERECRNRNLIGNLQGIFSWIGVPLNSGSETIGVISLGSRDPATIISTEQANLLQSIADQAAGAILKARLLDEAQRRARQLTTLNEVAQSLSSTLELVPLLNRILRSAVDILNCEAGSLLLIDQNTGEYVFETAVGPVANNLVGTRLPPNTGLVGKAVTSREAIIVNDVRRSKDWSIKTDTETGFKTNDLLVVPMIYRDDVTGVIEVINRHDGQPFSQDDQELLSAFASQATIALENARLFTLTDQNLTERVEELSVLQRIDRELNTSLEFDRALRVTLDWAMRQSRADAGLIGIVEENRIRIMASQGFGENHIADFNLADLPLKYPSIQEAINSGLPQLIQVNEPNGEWQQTLLPDARQQLTVTLRRESQVIGLVILESLTSGASVDEKFGFLTRLADHASVAITNATLYAEVQAANQAKSDFVSFVSHELKTPMTSIRGFSDLLASGVVGPINDNQANFLNTIRSNVDRMATLVSDLADVSRIEAGRLRLEFGAIPINEIIDEVVRSTRAQILEKKQTLIVNVPPDLPLIWGDRIRLIQILTNLVSNAYKYTQPEGLIQINAVPSENDQAEGSPKVLHITVRDNGFGISPENQPKIFQKFYRSDDQKVRDAPGTGLGLNITKQLVELQGGKIWFESEFRIGTAFHFTVPIAEAA
jgi:signal transduction histidine kinase